MLFTCLVPILLLSKSSKPTSIYVTGTSYTLLWMAATKMGQSQGLVTVDGFFFASRFRVLPILRECMAFSYCSYDYDHSCYTFHSNFNHSKGIQVIAAFFILLAALLCACTIGDSETTFKNWTLYISPVLSYAALLPLVHLCCCASLDIQPAEVLG